ncbi:LPS assembly lipoprotein LptE [Thalassoglobus sp.]|uniref:LPS assembly lipoprotein LptE n=1 Tax=Thalassoglobus sp. TaxID=2795869 RepID=UPI003AA99C09
MNRYSNSTRRTFAKLLVAVMGTVCLSGCGYVVGSPFGSEVRSVHIPTFTNDTYRRGYELQLTEAVQKKVELTTPFRIKKGPEADTRLIGNIISIDKRPANQNRYDDPRELELAIGIEVTWIDNRTGTVLAQRTTPIGPQLSHAIAHTSFAPETGQSLATATQDAVDQLANEIVGMMEAPW